MFKFNRRYLQSQSLLLLDYMSKSSGYFYFRSNHRRAEKLETLSPKWGPQKSAAVDLKNKSRKTAISAIHYVYAKGGRE
jgi:hypothetical protein